MSERTRAKARLLQQIPNEDLVNAIITLAAALGVDPSSASVPSISTARFVHLVLSGASFQQVAEEVASIDPAPIGSIVNHFVDDAADLVGSFDGESGVLEFRQVMGICRSSQYGQEVVGRVMGALGYMIRNPDYLQITPEGVAVMGAYLRALGAVSGVSAEGDIVVQSRLARVARVDEQIDPFDLTGSVRLVRGEPSAGAIVLSGSDGFFFSQARPIAKRRILF